ncbi:MAG: hypothetical protein F4Z01_02370, partial [Gammaproteobacteria bacterium]|nr:hypothetical protein [Gammaproteobacteria bacterium]
MPKFYLSNVQDFGKLAHILTNQNDESGEVCITDALSTAINTDQPELAYRDTVDKHLQLLTQLIEDPAYNHAEQLREFDAHWKILCDNAAGGSNELFVVWDGNSSESMQVRPPRLETGSDLQTKPVALAGSYTSDRNLTYALAIAKLETRQVIGKAISIWLSHLEPPPATQYNLLEWYFRIVAFADQPSQRELRKLRKKKYREFWLVFSAQIPNGETMFALHWNACSRSTFPASLDGIEADNWTVTPYRVRSISPSALIPRGGGSLDLKGMSVLLVG